MTDFEIALKAVQLYAEMRNRVLITINLLQVAWGIFG